LFRADGRTNGRTDVRAFRQTDMTNLIAAFCNFAKAPKIAAKFRNYTGLIDTMYWQTSKFLHNTAVSIHSKPLRLR